MNQLGHPIYTPLTLTLLLLLQQRSEFYKDMDYDEWIFGKNSFRMFHSESSVGPVSESATHEKERKCLPVGGKESPGVLILLQQNKKVEPKDIRGLSASLTLHSFNVTLFVLGSHLFLIQLQINTPTATLIIFGVSK